MICSASCIASPMAVASGQETHVQFTAKGEEVIKSLAALRSQGRPPLMLRPVAAAPVVDRLPCSARVHFRER